MKGKIQAKQILIGLDQLANLLRPATPTRPFLQGLTEFREIRINAGLAR